MAEFGANHPCFKPDAAQSGVAIGKLVSANLTVNLASGELYADDGLAEQLSEFSSGTIAMETDDMSDQVASTVYGCKVEGGVVTSNTNDTAPRGGLAYYKTLMRKGVKYYKGFYYPRVRAALGNDNAQTRGSSITFQTTQTTFTVFADDSGNWRETKTFTDKDSAAAWCEQKTAVSEYYAVNVTVQGAGDGKSVDTLGTYYVAKGEDFVMHVTGYANLTAVYDNGTDKATAVKSASGVYTLANVTANHEIAVIF